MIIIVRMADMETDMESQYELHTILKSPKKHSCHFEVNISVTMCKR